MSFRLTVRKKIHSSFQKPPLVRPKPWKDGRTNMSAYLLQATWSSKMTLGSHTLPNNQFGRTFFALLSTIWILGTCYHFNKEDGYTRQLSTGFVSFFRNNFPGLFQASDWSFQDSKINLNPFTQKWRIIYFYLLFQHIIKHTNKNNRKYIKYQVLWLNT